MVSNLGNVKSLNYGRTGKEKLMKPSKDGGGYLGLRLRINKEAKRYLVHRLVAITFLENPENKRTVNHKDSVRHNNILSNLEWATHSENSKHGCAREGYKNNFEGMRGIKSPYSKVVKQMDMDGNFIRFFYGLNEAHRNGYNMSCIHKCINGKRNHHKNYKWAYASDDEIAEKFDVDVNLLQIKKD